jgi:tetratricopeptide (TPR) repeat protein
MKETLDITNQDLDELFERYRKSPDSYVFVLLADACRKIDRVDEALEICEAGIKRHPDYASGYVVKAKCLHDLGKYEDARGTFESVLAIDEHNLVALKYLGMIEAKAGRFDSARGYLQHILKLDPANREIKKALLEVDEQEQLETGGTTGSSRTPQEAGGPGGAATPGAIELEASDELATITLADIFASQGYRDKALKIYREVLAKEPGNELVQQKIAVLADDSVDDVATGKPIELPADDDVEPYEDEELNGVGFEEIELGREKTELRTESKASEKTEPRTEGKASEKTEPRTEGKASEKTEPRTEGKASEKTEPRTESKASEKPPKREKRPVEPLAPTSKRTRREIDEGENIDHFKRWLNKLSN